MTPIRWRNELDRLRTGYWFIPLLMVLAGGLLAVLLITLDRAIPTEWLQNAWWLYQGDLDQVRMLLARVLSTGLGMIGLILSITLVPLTIAASQYGWIILRFFVRDTSIQLILGIFIATAVYSVAADLLITYYSLQEPPRLTATVAVLLGLIAFLAIIYLFDQVTRLLQASSIVAKAGGDLEQAVVADYPLRNSADRPQRRKSAGAMRKLLEREGAMIVAGKTGYVRAVDEEALMQLASERDFVALLMHRAGSYLVRGDDLARIWPASTVSDPEAARQVSEGVGAAFVLGEYRTMVQDTEFGFQSLVVMAVRALSPAINDPYTAMACIDRIGAGLSLVAERSEPSPYHYDAGHRLRLIADHADFRELTDMAFNQIRAYGCGNAEVLIRMLRTIATVAERANSEHERAALLHHAELIGRAGRTSLAEEWDRERVHAAYLAALGELGAPEPAAERSENRG